MYSRAGFGGRPKLARVLPGAAAGGGEKRVVRESIKYRCSEYLGKGVRVIFRGRWCVSGTRVLSNEYYS